VKYKILTILFGVSLATAAQATDVNETIDAAANGHVDISNVAGKIEVYGWSKNSVEVTGELGEKVEELVLERDGDRVTVKVKVPQKSSSKISSEIVVRLPEGSSIDVSGVSADIDVEDVSGEQSIHTVSGDVTTQAAAADVEAVSVSGDVSVEGDRKDAETFANTVSGDVTLFGLGGEVKANAVSGDVTIDEGSFDRVALESVNGDLFFLAELRKGGKLGVETVNGDVQIEFSGTVSADFDIDTFNGDIENCFGPKAERTSKYAPGWQLNFTEGGGDSSVTISTLNGDIHICQ
jgi:DUF4097 and DUF4098 domain-containing protein YvlB